MKCKIKIVTETEQSKLNKIPIPTLYQIIILAWMHPNEICSHNMREKWHNFMYFNAVYIPSYIQIQHYELLMASCTIARLFEVQTHDVLTNFLCFLLISE